MVFVSGILYIIYELQAIIEFHRDDDEIQVEKIDKQLYPCKAVRRIVIKN